MIGETTLHYKILEKLGEGGMGVVYKARDTKLDRNVAIKFLPKHIAVNADERKRFEIEAKAAAALNHPNIATIYSIEEYEPASGEHGSEMFIVMEYIDGQELGEIVGVQDFEHLPTETIVDYVTQIASGLQAAHEKGVVHRDVKSANIMVTEKGRIKIMDFGLAKVAGSDIRLTKEHTTVGTAAYMSPEQARGEEIDHRTDIWAFGVVLYELLTGDLPFPGEYEQAVIYSILNEDFPPLSENIPENIAHIVGRALQKSPEARYQNMDAALEDLTQATCMSAPENGVSRSSTNKRTSVKKNKWLFATAAVVFSLIAAIFYFFIHADDAEPQRRIPLAVADFVNHTGEKELNALSGMLITALEQSQRLAVASRTRMFDLLMQMGDSVSTIIDERLGREICRQAGINALAVPEIRKFGRVYSIDLKVLDIEMGGHLFTRQMKREGSESIPDLIDALAGQVRKELRESETEIKQNSRKIAEVTTPNLTAYDHYFKGEAFLSKLYLDKAKTAFEKAVELDSTFGLAHYRLAYALGWNSDHLASEPLKMAVKYIDRIPEKERYLVRAAQARQEQGFDAAVKVLKEMETLFPNDKEMLFNIGDYSFHANDFETAVVYLEKTLALDPDHMRAHYHFSDAVARRYTDPNYVNHDFRTALAKAKAELEKRPNMPELIGAIVTLHAYLEEYDLARQEIDAFMEIAADSQQVMMARLWLVSLAPYAGQYKDAVGALEGGAREMYAVGDTISATLGLLTAGIVLAEGGADPGGVISIFDETFPQRNRTQVAFAKNFLAAMAALAGDEQKAISVLNESPNGFDPVISPIVASFFGRCEESAPLVERLVNIPSMPVFMKLWNLYHLAECYYENGEYDLAEKTVRASLAIYSPTTFPHRAVCYPKGILLLGKIHEARGEISEARTNFEKFLTMWKNADPDLPDLLEARDRLLKL